jgi:hypothetical protein
MKFKIEEVRLAVATVWELYQWDYNLRRGFFNRRIGNWRKCYMFGSYGEAHAAMQARVNTPFVVTARYFDEHGREFMEEP